MTEAAFRNITVEKYTATKQSIMYQFVQLQSSQEDL